MIYDVGLADITAEFDQDSEAFFIGKSSFMLLLEAAIRHIPFDAEWYVAQYPDVKAALDDGLYKTAFQHYLEHGFMECRLPHAIEVDETFYLNEYQDVRSFIESKKVPSAQWHFENHGRSEGRIPYEGFSILKAERPALLEARPAA